VATPQQISDLVGAVMGNYGYLDIGVHLHGRADEAGEKALAAYDAGCRRFDCAIGGLGGCPFAQDALVGNLPTERLLEALSLRSVSLPGLKPLDTLLRASVEMGRQYSAGERLA
jgi:hydroxymethylglutaryl-CoA lyase